MSSRQLDEEAIFHLARRLGDVDRTEYLDQICAGDIHLRQRVDALLEVHEKERDFLKSAPHEAEPTLDYSPINECPGTTIGRYRLMEQIGEGGMGTVFVAEQERPVRRRVAMKIVKAGMDTKEVVARFEAERQALALMEHPNIAKVLDAGSTESGRPYFVMELVRGIPVTEYCDKKKLSVPERLELFVQICQAVQHAHQKGIIHRDIKPTNVLVADHDGKPVPKVIDFGVAKATNQRLTERTIYTRLQQIIGTPMYMSPEQAEFSGLDVDTRSDVYSLGVLLYELLTGVTPFDKATFEKAAYDEILRIIREKDPPNPSTKISVLGDSATDVSACRRSDPKRLHQVVRGDLDWIVMKAMDKDRTRRYDTAAAFGEDVQRHIDDEPIEARPPSTPYRIAKFVRRNRSTVVGVSLIILALMAGTIVASLGWRQAITHAERAKDEARRATEEAEKRQEALIELEGQKQHVVELLIQVAFECAMGGDFVRTEKLAERAKQAGASQEIEPMLLGLASLYRGETQEAVDRLKLVAADTDASVAAGSILLTALLYNGELDSYFELYEQLVDDPPATVYDRLFKGHAQIYYDSAKATENLRLAVAERPNWDLANVILAESLTQRSLDTDDFTLAEAAVAKARIGKSGLPRNAYATATYLHALHTAIRLAKRRQLDIEKLEEWETAALVTAEELSPYRKFAFGRAIRAMYYDDIGNTDQAESDWADAVHEGGGRLFSSWYGGFLYKNDRSQFALEQLPEPWPWFFTDLPNGKVEALRAYEELYEQGKVPAQKAIWWQVVLVFSGRKAEAEKKWRELAAADPPSLFMIEDPLNLFLGEELPEKIVARAKSSNSRKQLAAVYYYVAMHHLHNGKRDEAIKYLRKCLELDFFFDDIPYLAEGHLNRLVDHDGVWPMLHPIEGETRRASNVDAAPNSASNQGTNP